MGHCQISLSSPCYFLLECTSWDFYPPPNGSM
jgi:hypothetical protein